MVKNKDKVARAIASKNTIDLNLVKTDNANFKNINLVTEGADPTGVQDFYNVLLNAISKFGYSCTYYFPEGTYKLNTSITITQALKIKCDGTINYTGSGSAIIIKCPKNKIYINTLIASNGSCLKFLSDAELVYENKIEINRIIGKINGIEMTTAGFGVQYNLIEFQIIDVDGKAIYLNSATVGKSVGENRFKNGMLQGEYGVYMTGVYEGSVTGNRFNNLGFEGVTNAIYMKNTCYNSFMDCRSQENIFEKYLILEGRNYGNRIGFDMCFISLIDTSLATSGINFVECYCLNNTANMEIVSKSLMINGKQIEATPVVRKLKNLFITNPSTYIADIDANSLYNLYTDYMLNPNVTFTIGKAYYSMLFTDLLLLIPATPSGVTIQDADNNIILLSTNNTYDSSVVRIRRLTSNFGDDKWQIEKVTTL